MIIKATVPQANIKLLHISLTYTNYCLDHNKWIALSISQNQTPCQFLGVKTGKQLYKSHTEQVIPFQYKLIATLALVLYWKHYASKRTS